MPIKDLFSALSNVEKKKLKKTKEPAFINPMLAKLTDDYFSSVDWIYEHKFDGERCLAVKKDGNIHLLSRNRHEMNIQYPEIAQSLQKQSADNFIIDGEIVALDEQGLSNFELLQSRINLSDISTIAHRQKKTPVYYHVFDVLYAQGCDVRAVPLLARKAILKKMLRYNRQLLYTTHRSPDGLKYFKQACKDGWEGLIAKCATSSYTSARSSDWLKFKCSAGQELVIGGYTLPQGARTDFGALLVGYYQGAKLIYAGKVGTGYSADELRMFGNKLRKLAQKKCPFHIFDGSDTNVRWVKPLLVADFKFAEWTSKGKLRVPRYEGLRDDKAAKDVVKEVAK